MLDNTKLPQYLSKPLNKLAYELCYNKSERSLKLLGYSDADSASCADDRRSVSGYCLSLNKGSAIISWESRKQPTVALSTCEAEYMAFAATKQEGLYITKLSNDMDKGSLSESFFFLEDNQGTIA